MINWFDLMRQAQGGTGLDNLARQFGLSQQQTQAAVAAVMPAFAMGLQHAATNPTAMAQLFQTMSGGHYPAFWESATQAFSPQARREGKDLLDRIFGSDEVSRRVAHQAATFSGVGADILQQMLPLVAGMMAGGLTRMATQQGAMMQSLQTPPNQPASPPPSSGQTGAGAWADLWGQWLGAAAPRPTPTPTPAGGANPFEEMMASFMRNPASPPPKEEPEPAPSSAPEPTAIDAWGQMMETSQEMQRQHLASLQSIFEGVWGRRGS